ncbi:MAG: hypothetical protein Q7K37_00525, partial [Dehalococcoidia bacterium]|nr:hypothetical protein [Dehalococcoidia bacterium]
MARRTWPWLTVLSLTLATVVACDPGAPVIDAATPDPSTAAATQPPPSAGLALSDPAEAERVRKAL